MSKLEDVAQLIIWKQTNNSTDQETMPTYKQELIIPNNHNNNLITNTSQNDWKGYLNLSCPAVSHICNFTYLPPTFMIFEPNSTPIVWFESSLTIKKK